MCLKFEHADIMVLLRLPILQNLGFARLNDINGLRLEYEQAWFITLYVVLLLYYTRSSSYLLYLLGTLLLLFILVLTMLRM